MGLSSGLFLSAETYPLPVLTVSSMYRSAPSSKWHKTWSLFKTSIPALSEISPAVTTAGPLALTVRRFGPSTSICRATPFRFKTMSVTSSPTPATDENSCNTLSICTLVTAAPCRLLISTRRKALPKVSPNPRSSGSATTVA